jgi:hypothetical protein
VVSNRAAFSSRSRQKVRKEYHLFRPWLIAAGGVYDHWGWRFMTLTEDNDNVPLVPLKSQYEEREQR